MIPPLELPYGVHDSVVLHDVKQAKQRCILTFT